MLDGIEVTANVAVSDIEKSKKFYGETLGLKQKSQDPFGVTYQCGPAKLFVYVAPTAGSAKSTVASWEVDDVKSLAEDLAKKDIKFEHFDFPGAEHDGPVHILGGYKAAWFKDPDGNTLGLVHSGV